MKTAVEWLYETLWKQNDYSLPSNILEKAKEMEKEQIIDARQDGHYCTYAEYGGTPKCYLDGSNEQYYNETFKK